VSSNHKITNPEKLFPRAARSKDLIRIYSSFSIDLTRMGCIFA